MNEEKLDKLLAAIEDERATDSATYTAAVADASANLLLVKSMMNLKMPLLMSLFMLILIVIPLMLLLLLILPLLLLRKLIILPLRMIKNHK